MKRASFLSVLLCGMMTSQALFGQPAIPGGELSGGKVTKSTFTTDLLSDFDQIDAIGHYKILMFNGDSWRKSGFLSFGKHYRSKAMNVRVEEIPGNIVRLRLIQAQGGKAHIDSITLNGNEPLSASSWGDSNPLKADELLAKISENDFDVIDATGLDLEVLFPLSGGQRVNEFMHLALTARVEASQISKSPFRYPKINIYGRMSERSHFYHYKIGSENGGIRVDGDIRNESLGEPFFRIYPRGIGTPPRRDVRLDSG